MNAQHLEYEIAGALREINGKYATLSDSERKVADYVTANPKKALHFTVRELAKQSGTSQAAITRFCRHIGFDSFNNFKIRLARDVFDTYDELYTPNLDLESETSPLAVTHSIIGQTQRALGSLEALIDEEVLLQCIEALRSARSIILFGVGASGVVALDLMQKLARLGMRVFYSAEVDLQLTVASTLTANDLAFIISYSGETEVIVEVANQASKRGCPIIALTMENHNTIQNLADFKLRVPATERIYRQGAGTSRINQLALIDILYSLLVSQNLDASIQAIEETMAITHRKQSRG
ncbi:MAG TPA: MurR/RpiR family transcriptional regulator [Sphaerochaeta sp.]|jgi:DNA-binding MurR/RpiR family transcriptional regulator|nr:MurR/RpiR family transcriptional regulator [Spirochaetales bacterium]HPX28257.1 MurR/RpiR family transcriptional regulator [Sphaerochaeta sp.]